MKGDRPRSQSALDIATLSKYAPTKSVAAFSITQDSILTIWNDVLGIGAHSTIPPNV
jgi:hypothetical protein